MAKEKLKKRGLSPKMGEEFIQKVYKTCGPYTMTGPGKMYALYKAVCYVIEREISGCMVECGVWKGGSSMIMATTLKLHKEQCRDLYLYDTYTGMSKPSNEDRRQNLDELQQAEVLSKWEQKQQENYNEWCFSSLTEVKRNLSLTGYPEQRLFFVKGKVEDTLQKIVPESSISILRLDTDWYQSTKKELSVLFPKLAIGGILIIDDYYAWGGQKKAVDNFFANFKEVLFTRIDKSGAICIKGDNCLLPFNEGVVHE